MQEINIDFNFKARYYKLGEIDLSNPRVWFVLHGYGQLAQYFIKKFDILINHNICVIAPEGLSRFYLEDVQSRAAGGSNRVGATWMTRENREMDIKNYLVYLQTIYNTEVASLSTDPKLTILGFSQGAATATRWILTDQIPFQQFILWAGIFPNDMDFERGKSIFTDKKIISVYGDDDPFITPDRIREAEDLAVKLQVQPTLVTFKGKHEIHAPSLLNLI